MAKRLVASDASPLIGLAAAGAFPLARKLFGTVTVTAAVRREIMAGGELPRARELAAAIQSGWIKVARNPAGTEIFPELGAGEASTLVLAMKHRGDCLVLMDEPLGRAQARALKIAVTGLAGALLAAKRAHLVKSVRPFFEELAKSDFRISTEIIRAVLEEAEEH